ncbi:MAG: SLBB domain-containing protein [Melioribacteraceae bacterium]|nr:SLBB domain-containing protein [Melioribacteraceae bacterium]MCF8413755.1 SLBB domain-containing protein [Melioribacteraceae bacterium]MCF8431133.1 SLBB domain-containing protein [Melioribacteraceae bacterium]
MRKILFILLFGLSCSITFSQVADYEVGARSGMRQTQGGLFDYSDPESINMKISVWGFVKYPGKYIIQDGMPLIDILSYAGGPSDNAHLEDIRIYRDMKDGTEKLFKVDYDDLWWNEEEFASKNRDVPVIKAGDVIIVTGSPRFYFRDYFTISLQIVSTIISLTLFIINVTSN